MEISLTANPKLLAFVTHGGINSVLEGAHYGVPILTISLFVDQHRNAKMLEYRKTAIVVPKTEITETNLFESLTMLTQGKTAEGFRKSAKILAGMLATRPMSPKERLVKHVNFAIQNKVDHLDIEIRKHHFIKYYNLDIFGFIGFSVAVLLFLVLIIFKVIGFVFVKALNRKVKKL